MKSKSHPIAKSLPAREALCFSRLRQENARRVANLFSKSTGEVTMMGLKKKAVKKLIKHAAKHAARKAAKKTAKKLRERF